jgi:hypothetical protein
MRKGIGAASAAALILIAIGGCAGMARTLPNEIPQPVLRYEIWVELDHPARMLHGRETISWTNTSEDDVPDMLFHLYFNAFKNENSTYLEERRADSSWIRGGRIREDDWGWIDITKIALADGTNLKPSAEFVTRDAPRHPGDQTVLRAVFPAPVKPGETVLLELEFESRIPRLGERTGASKDAVFIAQWFPKPGVYESGKGWNCHEYHRNSEFFADFADFAVHITVPADFVVGSSGKLERAAAAPSGKTVTYTYRQSRIHDFAWTAGRNFIKVERDFIASKEVSSSEYERAGRMLKLGPDEIRLPDVRMILLIERQHRGQTERHFRALKAAIKYYGLWYGPYPYETVTMVDPPFRTGSGGMEYPTLFTAGTSILKRPQDLSLEGVIVHEFGHGYWYGLVANNEFEEAWLDEGINTYATAKAMSESFGPGELAFSVHGIPLDRILRMPRVLDWETARALAIQHTDIDPIVTKSWEFSGYESYAMNVYERAATCLKTLEGVLGEAVMARVMRTFQTRFRFRHPTTHDFIAVVNETSGRDLTWFFDELFFSTRRFDYGIASFSSVEFPKRVGGVFDLPSGREIRESAREKEPGVPDKKKFLTTVTIRRYGEARVGGDVPVKLKIVFEDGREEVRTWNGRERWVRIVVETPARARFAQVDPEGIWIIDADLANNSYRLRASRKGILRMTAKVFFAIQNVLLLFSSSI